ncbi:trehalase domain-containing protein [Ditylenchus destructor]|uniref:Trehalase n=1 Tax=Ditylenchus destructor TaxID=166010 RepID=A0AAD4QZ97_9BILA|nr:trehalase domain-containing protein [Ditylenchus destructor]
MQHFRRTKDILPWCIIRLVLQLCIVSGCLARDFDDTILNEDTYSVNCSVPNCEGPLSEIFCSGPLVQANWFFELPECPVLYSKMRLKFEPEVVIKNFYRLQRPLHKVQFKEFCEKNFENVSYLKPAHLPDWKRVPTMFAEISDPRMSKLALELHNIWPELSREFIPDVHENNDRYPVLPVPNRFIAPGGQFQVYFYWDTYWILKGLLFSEMYDTARGVLDNFAFLMKHKGFIPNSGDIQLSGRSQPPLFTQMIWDFYNNYDKDQKSFLEEFLPLAEKEMDWWQDKRAVSVTKNGSDNDSGMGGEAAFSLYQYRAETNCPTTLGDYQQGMESGKDPEFYWSSTASACESGWDFSTRWFDMEGENSVNIKGLRTNLIVPVDLNDAIQEVLFDESAGVWFDYDIETKELRKMFFPSNIFPLLLNTTTAEGCERVVGYLKDLDVFKYKGGIPSSLEGRSKEQWDFPNGWAPITHLFVMSLLQCPQTEAQERAKKVADGFLTTMYNGLLNPIKGLPAQVWEKYDVRFDNGRSGFGGGYPVQAGFGWTNGAALDFIRYFYATPSPQRQD